MSDIPRTDAELGYNNRPDDTFENIKNRRGHDEWR
jgi:hypothetical protein